MKQRTKTKLQYKYFPCKITIRLFCRDFYDKTSYKTLENKLTSAALEYYNDKYNSYSGDVVIIKASTLKNNGYLSKFEDVNGNKITDADDAITVKNTYYWYSPISLSEDVNGSVKGISKSKLLFNSS